MIKASDRQGPLDSYLSEQEKLSRFSGSVLLRIRGRTVLDKGYGTADRLAHLRVFPDTPFQIASVSKQFTAAAMLQLEESGRISATDPIESWIAGSPPEWKPITIHHLLTHTSGLAHWREMPELDLFAPAPPERILSVFAAHRLKFPPGERWAYSSPGYHLLARIVEAASRERYTDLLRRHIFEPLGLAGTVAGNRPLLEAGGALGYAHGTPVIPFELGTASMGAGDVWSTTGDLARWDQALSVPGRILKQSSLQRLFTRHANLPLEESQHVPVLEEAAYGYGWYLGNVSGVPVRFHSGDNPGYRALNLWVPGADLVFCVLSNEESTDVLQIALWALGEVGAGRWSRVLKHPTVPRVFDQQGRQGVRRRPPGAVR